MSGEKREVRGDDQSLRAEAPLAVEQVAFTRREWLHLLAASAALGVAGIVQQLRFVRRRERTGGCGSAGMLCNEVEDWAGNVDHEPAHYTSTVGCGMAAMSPGASRFIDFLNRARHSGSAV